MISYPRPNQPVQVWYNPKVARHARLHGLTGIVVIPSRGKPRNHGVEIAGVMYVVHAGNLRKPPEGLR